MKQQKKKKLIDAHFPISRRGGAGYGDFLPPKGGLLESATALTLVAAGCFKAEGDFDHLMATTNGNPCSICERWNSIGPACKAFVFHTAWDRYVKARDEQESATKWAITPHNADDGPLKDMSVAAIAKEYGLSKSVVRGLRGPDGKLSAEVLTAAALAKTVQAITA